MTLDPMVCGKCGGRATVVASRKCTGYRRRRHACICGHRWNTYISRLNPKRALRKILTDRRLKSQEK